ncbi:MAG: hypothetical protein SFU86_22015 [Pirellulaceae bacterium]|nr:hypothetical protein [Pirellulaceae bacterium]
MTIVYCDTSLVIDYLLAQGREPEAAVSPSHYPESEHQREEREYWEALFRHDKRYQFATRLRSIVGWNVPTARMAISPFVLLELDEWYAEECFKRHALDGTHVKAIQTHSRKEIGEFIQKVVRDSEENYQSFAGRIWGEMASRIRGESIAGIHIEAVDQLKFDADAFDKVTLLSHMQLGMADIVHLLAADSLKCTHFASTDSDFNRLRVEIEASFKFKVLFKDEIFGIVKPQAE